MSRLRALLVGVVFSRTAAVSAVVALALAGLAISASGRADEPRREARQPDKRLDRGAVLDLNEVSAGRAAKRARRPAEKVGRDEMASVERQIRSRSTDAAAPDDGVSPGAPSDEQVRQELRQLRRAKSGAAGGPIGRGSGGLMQPASGQFTSPFGQRWGRLHAGIDLAAPTGTAIRAAAAGRVILMAPTGGYGNYTCIDHGNSVSTCYAHQSRYATSRGAMVEQGELIGYVGNTGHSFGAHLHFEVRIDGKPVDPMDYL